MAVISQPREPTTGGEFDRSGPRQDRRPDGIETPTDPSMLHLVPILRARLRRRAGQPGLRSGRKRRASGIHQQEM
jgi:hypothetical protein